MTAEGWEAGVGTGTTLSYGAVHSTSPFSRHALQADAVVVARALLGGVVASTLGGRTTVGRIVETEAYFGPLDPASHAAERIGRTRRNEPMFGEAGTAYIYRIYGVHRCFNVVTDRVGIPSAVLIRALEPMVGEDVMAARRVRSDRLCAGPGRLAQALGIDEELNGHPLDTAPLSLHVGTPVPDSRVSVTGRVGVSKGSDWPLRFLVTGSECVSVRRGPECRHSQTFRNAIRRHRSGPPLEETTA